MPTNRVRRRRSRRKETPDAVRLVIAGVRPPYSVENYAAIVNALWLGAPPFVFGKSTPAHQLALELVHAWRRKAQAEEEAAR